MYRSLHSDCHIRNTTYTTRHVAAVFGGLVQEFPRYLSCCVIVVKAVVQVHVGLCGVYIGTWAFLQWVIYIDTQLHTCLHNLTYASTHVHTYMHTCSLMHAHCIPRTCSLSCIHIHATLSHICIHVYTHTHTHTHKHSHTQTHTHTHKQILLSSTPLPSPPLPRLLLALNHAHSGWY